MVSKSDKWDGPDRRTVNEWHLNKGVTVSVVALLVVNIASSIFWAATLTADVDTLKQRPNLTERVVKLESLTGEHGRLLSRIDLTLDKLDTTLDRVATEQIRRASIIERVEAEHK